MPLAGGHGPREVEESFGCGIAHFQGTVVMSTNAVLWQLRATATHCVPACRADPQRHPGCPGLE